MSDERQSAENWEMILDEEFKTLHRFIDDIKEKLRPYPPLDSYKYLQPMRDMIIAAWNQLREQRDEHIKQGESMIDKVIGVPYTEELTISGQGFTVIMNNHYLKNGLFVFCYYPDSPNQIQPFTVEQTGEGYKVLPHPVRGVPLFAIENEQEICRACELMLHSYKPNK